MYRLKSTKITVPEPPRYITEKRNHYLLKTKGPLFRLSPTTTSLYRKEKSHRVWRLLFFLICGLLILMASRAHSSPPFSRGARPIAVGGAYTAVAGDSYSLFYNPAGLYEIKQKELAMDYGRSHSELEPARSDFNGILSMPYTWKENYLPLSFGIYGEQPAEGSHILDFTAGTAKDLPIDQLTKGIIKFPVQGGVALTLRHQQGDLVSTRVGKSKIGLGLTAGLFSKIGRKHQVGFALRNMYSGDTHAPGPSAHVGVQRHHNEQMTVFGELEYASGGIWRIHPGIEWLFYRGVLRPRLGWGFRDNKGIDSVSTGLGFYLSPIQIDLAFLIPLKTLSDDMDVFRASLIYRFGKPQFTQIYYDKALEAASNLDEKVLQLTVKEAELKASLSELNQKLHLSREELTNSTGRIESLKNQDLLGQRDAQIRELRERIHRLEVALDGQKQENHSLRQKRETIRTHTVGAGDTLQSLAEKYYGDPNQWKKIFNANTDKIDRGLPRVGAKLVIP